LNLGHGASGQSFLIDHYDRWLKHYRHLPLKNPVIILCDNDDGPARVFKSGAKVSGRDISKTTQEPFYYLTRNLYLVKIPEGSPPTTRDAEDLFPAVWLSQLLDGKPFDKKKEHADHTAYGKVVFADRIVRPNAKTIDFTGFEELLQRIAACIADYGAKSTAILSLVNVTSGGDMPSASTSS
jgi:hypothetical protein